MKDLAPADESPNVFDLRALAGTERLDLFLAGQNLGLTRSQLRRLINDGHVLLNGQAAKGSHRVRLGDQVSLTVPPPRPTKVVPQWMPLTMVFEDDDLVVIEADESDGTFLLYETSIALITNIDADHLGRRAGDV